MPPALALLTIPYNDIYFHATIISATSSSPLLHSISSPTFSSPGFYASLPPPHLVHILLTSSSRPFDSSILTLFPYSHTRTHAHTHTYIHTYAYRYYCHFSVINSINNKCIQQSIHPSTHPSNHFVYSPYVHFTCTTLQFSFHTMCSLLTTLPASVRLSVSSSITIIYHLSTTVSSQSTRSVQSRPVHNDNRFLSTNYSIEHLAHLQQKYISSFTQLRVIAQTHCTAP